MLPVSEDDLCISKFELHSTLGSTNISYQNKQLNLIMGRGRFERYKFADNWSKYCFNSNVLLLTVNVLYRFISQEVLNKR